MFALFVKLSYDLHLPALTGYIPQSTGDIFYLLFSFVQLLVNLCARPQPLQATSTAKAVVTNSPAPTGTHLLATSTTATVKGAISLATYVSPFSTLWFV